MIALLLAQLAVADPTATELQEAWAPLRDQLAAEGVYALDWDDKEWREMADGKVTKRRERLQGTDRVVGAIWTPASRDATWVAVQDEEHWDAVSGLTEEYLPGSTFQKKLFFQHLDLPWPFANRQWVILIENNLELMKRSKGAIWERTWDVSSERGAKAEDPTAIWVDVNDGGWLAVEVGGGTLLCYHVRTRIGGNIPDDLVTRYAFSTLGGMLGKIKEDAENTVEAHYDAEHTPIKRPDGSEIPPFSE